MTGLKRDQLSFICIESVPFCKWVKMKTKQIDCRQKNLIYSECYILLSVLNMNIRVKNTSIKNILRFVLGIESVPFCKWVKMKKEQIDCRQKNLIHWNARYCK